MSSRSHELEQLQEGRICADCNIGWMSRLEVAAQPLLRPLFQGARLVTDFSPKQRATLSRWAVKTAFVLNSKASNFDQKIAAKHFHELFENLTPVPAGVHVLRKLKMGSKISTGCREALWHAYAKPELNGVTQQACRRSHIRSRCSFASYYCRSRIGLSSGWQLAIWAGIHVPLWPIRGPIAHYRNADAFPKTQRSPICGSLSRQPEGHQSPPRAQSRARKKAAKRAVDRWKRIFLTRIYGSFGLGHFMQPVAMLRSRTEHVRPVRPGVRRQSSAGRQTAAVASPGAPSPWTTHPPPSAAAGIPGPQPNRFRERWAANSWQLCGAFPPVVSQIRSPMAVGKSNACASRSNNRRSLPPSLSLAWAIMRRRQVGAWPPC